MKSKDKVKYGAEKASMDPLKELCLFKRNILL